MMLLFFQVKEATEQAVNSGNKILEVGVVGAVLILALIGIGIQYYFQRKDMKNISARHAQERVEWRQEDEKKAEMLQRHTEALAGIVEKNTDALTHLSTLIQERVTKRR